MCSALKIGGISTQFPVNSKAETIEICHYKGILVFSTAFKGTNSGVGLKIELHR